MSVTDDRQTTDRQMRNVRATAYSERERELTFAKNYSQQSAPLRELLAKDKPFQWKEAQEKSFSDIRDELYKTPNLGYTDRNKPLRIILDACATGLGYMLVNVSSDGTEI